MRHQLIYANLTKQQLLRYLNQGVGYYSNALMRMKIHKKNFYWETYSIYNLIFNNVANILFFEYTNSYNDIFQHVELKYIPQI